MKSEAGFPLFWDKQSRGVFIMLKDKRYYTLMLFAPTANSQFRRYNIPHKVMYATMILAGIGLLTLMFGAYSAVRYASLAFEYQMAKMDNRKLRQENDEVQKAQDKLEVRLAAQEPILQKLAESTGVKPSTDIGKNIGSGGPDTKDMKDLEKATTALEIGVREIKEVVAANQIKLAAIPSIWPVRGYITSGVGDRSNPFGGGGNENHPGLDIAATHGTSIEAGGDGIVIKAGPQGGYGNLVVIDHGYGITTRYGHMSRIDVKVGDHVHRGMQLGAVGSTGRSTGPHLHYEVRLYDRVVDPMNYLPKDQ
jgi:murein DD-endopeptidase MepM/ murein hydrolase activator NlpD